MTGGQLGTRQRREPYLTVGPRLITLNVGAYRLLGEPAAVEYLWDQDEHIIGLRATEDTDVGYRLSAQTIRRGGARAASSAAFLGWAGIAAAGQRFRPWLTEDVLCIRIDDDMVARRAS